MNSNYVPKIYKPKAEDVKIKMVLYGSPGVGKTSLAATADLHPLTAKTLFINIESGVFSLTDAAILGLKEAPDIIDLKEFEELEKIFWWLAQGDHPYQTVVIDSLTELQLMNLETVVRDQLGKKTKSGIQKLSLDDIWEEDYGTSTSQMRRIVRKFRDLPMHVIFICHDRTDQDKQKNIVVGPALTPKFRTSVLGYVDIVSYMFVDNVKNEDTGETLTVRRLLNQPYDKWIAKDRSPGGKLGVVLDNPTISLIMELILS